MEKEIEQDVSDNIIKVLDIVSKALIANSPEEIAKREKELYRHQKLVMLLSTILIVPQLQMYPEVDAEIVGRELLCRFKKLTTDLDANDSIFLSEKCGNITKFLLKEMDNLIGKYR